MTITKEALEKRKAELQNQHDDLAGKINQGREALKSMDAQLTLTSGAIQQCDFFLKQEKEGKNKK